MNVTIRQETEKDYKLTEHVVEKAFETAEYSDHKEQFLVANLRKGEAFVPQLSIVAELDEQIIGHILLTKILIKNEEKESESLALAPVSVLPEFQNQSVGSKLIHASLRIAKESAFKSVVVLGHEKYYPRFGFKPASTWGITPPFKVRDEVFMALELEEGGFDEVIYGKEFME